MAATTQVSGEMPADGAVPAPRRSEQPRFVAAIDLVALPTAVAVARMFVSDTLRR
jgi:hypothetical protein